MVNLLVRASPTEAKKSSYCWYQGGDCIGAQQCTIAALIRSNWPSVTGGMNSLENKVEKEGLKVIVSKNRKEEQWCARD